MTIDRRLDYYKRCVQCGQACEPQLNERYRRGLELKAQIKHYWHLIDHCRCRKSA